MKQRRYIPPTYFCTSGAAGPRRERSGHIFCARLAAKLEVAQKSCRVSMTASPVSPRRWKIFSSGAASSINAEFSDRGALGSCTKDKRMTFRRNECF